MKPGAKWVCVCGSRSITNRRAVTDKIEQLTFWFSSLIVITGGCGRGPDRFAEEWASANRHTLKIYHADWDTHKKAAGPIRNREMAIDVVAHDGYLIAFHDGVSTGTADMIRQFIEAGGKESHLRIVRGI